MALAEGQSEGAASDVKDARLHGPHVSQDSTDDEAQVDAFAASFHQPVVETRVEDFLEIVYELIPLRTSAGCDHRGVLGVSSGRNR